MPKTGANGPISDDGKTRHRIFADVNTPMKMKVEYWSHNQGVTQSDFVSEALTFYIAALNSDFDNESLIVDRLNQLIDQYASMRASIENQQSAQNAALEQLVRLASSDTSWLTDETTEV